MINNRSDAEKGCVSARANRKKRITLKIFGTDSCVIIVLTSKNGDVCAHGERQRGRRRENQKMALLIFDHAQRS